MPAKLLQKLQRKNQKRRARRSAKHFAQQLNLLSDIDLDHEIGTIKYGLLCIRLGPPAIKDDDLLKQDPEH